MRLPHDTLLQALLQIEDPADLVGEHFSHRDAGPTRDHRRHGLAVDAGVEQRLLSLNRRQLGLERLHPFTEPVPLLGRRGGNQFTGRRSRGCLRREAAPRLADFPNELRFGFPTGIEGLAPGRERLGLALELADLFGMVGTGFHRALENPQGGGDGVELPLAVLERRRRGRLADGDACRGRVDEAHRLVGELAAGDVAVRQPHALHHRLVENRHSMVGFEGGNEPADHPHGDLLGRLLHLDHLEAPRERCVLLEVFFVFGPGRGSDRAQLSAGQGGLEEVGRIPLPGLSAGTDEGVGFVDEENDRHRRLLHLVNHRLEPVFELSLHPGTGLEETEIEGPEDNSLERLRHVPLRDPLRKPLDHRGLSDACLAGQDRVVLTATGEDVDQLTDLGVAAQNGVDLSSPCPGGEVDCELVEAWRARGTAGRGGRRLSIGRLAVWSRHRGFDRAVEDRRGIARQLLRGDSPKLIGDRQRPPGERFLPHQRCQEPGTADLGQPLIDRGKQPRFFGQQADFGGEQGGARVPGLQPVDCLAQVSE